MTGANIQQGTQKFALVVSGPLELESPPPAPPSPPGPQGPALPPAPAGDTVVLGVSLPSSCSLLQPVVASPSRGCAAAQRRPPAAPAAGLPAGWRMLTDPSSGYAYYVGPAGQTQWEAPVQELKPTAPPRCPAAPHSRPAGRPASTRARARSTTTTRRRSSRSGLLREARAQTARRRHRRPSTHTGRTKGEACLASSLINSRNTDRNKWVALVQEGHSDRRGMRASLLDCAAGIAPE